MKKMSNTKFWKIVDKMNWGSDNNYKRISDSIVKLEYGTMDEMVSFTLTLKQKNHDIEKLALSLSDKDYGEFINQGDDGLSDVLHNIIGCGKKAYSEVMEDYTKFSNYGDVESFAYVVHPVYEYISENNL